MKTKALPSEIRAKAQDLSCELFYFVTFAKISVRMSKPQNKLLSQNISIPQLAGYSAAALVGMSIIFSAFCFAMDIRPVFSSNTGLFKHEFITVNKKVSMLSNFKSNRNIFSAKEIDEIRGQEFVKSVSYFTPCRYEVRAYTDPTGNIPAFATDMFFESVPDRLLDGAGEDWKWNVETKFIPVIIPRSYLALYNFGFAGSRSLPQISENIVKKVKFKVLIIGQGRREEFTGSIVGFSDYLNTILVPDGFIQWANDNFGDNTHAGNYSRLIVEVKNPADPTIAEFFAQKDYDVNENKGEQGKLSYFLKLLIVIVLAVGCLVMLPAIGLMLLSINLLVYKNQITLGNLILLGYRRSKLAQPYNILVLALNFGIGASSFVVSLFARKVYQAKLGTLGIEPSGAVWITAAFVLIFVAIVTLVDVLWIHGKIKGLKIPARG